MSKKEKFGVLGDESTEYFWVCPCGNNTDTLGFQPCNKNGDYIETRFKWWETLIGMGWKELYACEDCGRIIKQGTGEIIGQNLNAFTYDDFLEQDSADEE